MGIGTVLGIGSGLISGFSNYTQQEAEIEQQALSLQNQAASSRYQGSQLGYQADVTAEEAITQQFLGNEELKEIDAQRTDLAEDYRQEKGSNVASMASANVDLSSGSALDALMGNAQSFAKDMSQNSRNMELAKWQNSEIVKALNKEANYLEQQEQYMYDQATYYEQVAESLSPSLLQSLLAGAGGVLGGISMMGSSSGSSSSSKSSSSKSSSSSSSSSSSK